MNRNSDGKHSVRSFSNQNRDGESVRRQRRNHDGIQVASSLFAIRMRMLADDGNQHTPTTMTLLISLMLDNWYDNK